MSRPSLDQFQQLILDSALPTPDKDTFLYWATTTHTRLQRPVEDAEFLKLLASIPTLPHAGCFSLASLSFILRRSQGPLPAFDIIRCYTRLWLALPESAKANQDPSAKLLLQDAESQVGQAIGTVPSQFKSDANTEAVIDPETQRILTHRQLSHFIEDFAIPVPHDGTQSQPTVAIALPQGYLSGLAVLAVSCYYTAAPINIAGGAAQLRSDVELAQAQQVLVLQSDVEKLGLHERWVAEAGIQVILVVPNEDMTFRMRPLSPLPPRSIVVPPTPNKASDLGLILFTSGTSGTKKVVPIPCVGLLTGVQCVIDSWGLTPADSCVNMMPLNHVGGIVRNLFAPILSGGSTILCPAFDPNQFWDQLEAGHGTWYYASPSMHMSILAEAGQRGGSVSSCKLRLVCNAAGGLLPALAVRLRDTFSCTVLPSYGMTECMPISTPPLNYTLDRVGTSGIGCGPELTILDESDNRVSPGEVGRINVRGGPTFPGYLKNGIVDKSVFNADGWFDTGDLGSLDQDGYLYLTGRSKEVINRGGEIISPFEVEEAITIASQDPKSPLYKRIRQVIAFSAPHEVLQEVVGVAVVTAPDTLRPDLRDLNSALKSSLHAAKLPIVLVYMDALPTSNNKLVRIKLAERMDMKPVTNDMTIPERHFEAVCPPLNSALTTKISNATCILGLQSLENHAQEFLGPDLDAHVEVSRRDGTPILYLAPGDLFKSEAGVDGIIERLNEELRSKLDGILIPTSTTFLPQPFPRLANGAINESALDEMIEALKLSQASAITSETEQKVRKAFAEILNFPVEEIMSDSDFFALGGESLSAGQLLSVIRRDIGVRIPVDKLFTAPQVCSLAALVDSLLDVNNNSEKQDTSLLPKSGCTETYSSTNPLVLFINLLPILLFYPMKMAFQWTLLMYCLSTLSHYWSEPNVGARFVALVASMFASRQGTQIVAPLFGIAFKWVVIGKYRAGKYPMWGPYHTRWWITDKVLRIAGKGIFRHFDASRILYLRLLGASIGKNVTIEKGTTLGEYDLLSIGDNVHLDRCICRPFAPERNTTMYLGQITIGSNSSIGLKTHVAAGAMIPRDTFLGANSSSYEIDPDDNSDRRPPPKNNPWVQIFCILPVQLFVLFISSLPWMAGLFGIVMSEPTKATDSVKSVINWWATPHRISFHYFAQALNVSVRPFVWFALLVGIKRLLNVFAGRAIPGTADDRTRGDRYRKQLLGALVPHGSLKSLTKLFGGHYESTSIAVRAMGGKVGKRVYWPGTGPSIEDFDLIEVGDDVVFGSRSHLVTSDAQGSDFIRIGRGAMIADRVVLMPGADIGEKTVVGSGAFIRRQQRTQSESVWVGNKRGSAICLSIADNASIAERNTRSGDHGDRQSLLSFSDTLHGTEMSTLSPSHSPNASRRSSISSLDAGAEPHTEMSFLAPPSLSNRGTAIPMAIRPNSRLSLPTQARPTHSRNVSGASTLTPSPERRSFSTMAPSFHTRNESTSSLIPDSTQLPSTPFGRAFYGRQAPYYVLNQPTIFLYSTFITIFVQCFWNVATISTIILSQAIHRTKQFEPHWYRPLKIYAFDVCVVSALLFVMSLFALGTCIVAKWALLGRRKPGNYDWDKSSYCQRWQVFLTIEALRRRCFGGNGVLGMLTGTYFSVLYFRSLGAKIGKDCALFAGGRPSLVFTEPDLLTLGDRVSVDDASLVGHINSRGRFSLNRLEVGDRSVLRSGSRLLSGAKMGEEAVLLEHTLIMAGDEADDGATYQGWPAERVS